MHGALVTGRTVSDIEIAWYGLDDRRRVVVQGGMMTALDMSQGTAGRGAGDRRAKFINTKSMRPCIPNKLAYLIIEPVIFRVQRGSVAYGDEATALADLCDAVLAARKDGRLNYQQERIVASGGRVGVYSRGAVRSVEANRRYGSTQGQRAVRACGRRG